MKRSYFPSITMALLLISAYPVFAENKADNKKRELNLIDLTPGFSVLKDNKDYISNDFFSIVYNSDISSRKDVDLNSFSLYSSFMVNGGAVRSEFDLSLYDSLNRRFILSWDTATPKFFNFEQKDSISIMTDLAYEAAFSSAENILINKKNRNFVITDIHGDAVIQNGVSLPGTYSFTVNSHPSLFHRTVRTALQVLLLNGIGVVNYFVNKKDNIGDWEYDLTLEDAKKKLTAPWVIDPNNFRVNTMFHIYAGSLYYQAASSNGFGIAGSTISAFSGSLFWEYVGEYRESVSLNDMIFTTLGGALLAQGMTATGIFIEKNFQKNIVRDLTVFVFDPLRVINRYLDSIFYPSFKVNLLFVHPAVNAAGYNYKQ